MESVEFKIGIGVKDAVSKLYNQQIDEKFLQVQKTHKDFAGDFTVVLFPLLKISRKSPEETGNTIGKYLKENSGIVDNYQVIKGFLNLEINNSYWSDFLKFSLETDDYGISRELTSGKTIMVEYSSPNTNKPLHLGHIRNNLLGYSVSNILKATGNKVIKVNLVNDRGIHICKSMLAWRKFGVGETPMTTRKEKDKGTGKGDHFVGFYYVKFEQEYKKQIKKLIEEGQSEVEANRNAQIINEAQELLRNWEANNKETIRIWKLMNRWVYNGFRKTYKNLGVNFDKTYYESKTYLFGKKIILKGLKEKHLYKKEDGSIWADLTSCGLDHKVLLRSDGTSVYMTQDVGTAHQRFTEYSLDQLIYVVGNEQNYHFQALTAVLKKLGFEWADKIHHLSYGMVELPEGKMKSREGTVVDADDLIEEMIQTARQMSIELGKLESLNEEEKEKIIRIIGLGALKYFILKVDPKKNMVFDPKESIDFNGNTGPFIQYTYARICSVLRKAEEAGIEMNKLKIPSEQIIAKEKELIKLIYDFPGLVKEAAENLSPALIANYIYDLAKEYNQFYHDFSILKADKDEERILRLLASKKIAEILKTGMKLLGIEMPERM